MWPVRARIALGLAALASALLAASCGSSSSQPPATPTTPAPVAPTITEPVWTDTLPVGGSKVYSFTVTVYGEVDVTLTSIGGSNVPSTVFVGLGVGTPTGTTCSIASPTNVQAGTTPQVIVDEEPGTYCVGISDVGNLAAPATFSVTIAHS